MSKNLTETKAIVFDMDGTIADLYGVENWLPMLRAENPRPYRVAEPMWDMNELADILNELKKIGYMIIITSWLSMDASSEYNHKVRGAKKNWLDDFNFPYDELHFVKYGTTKADCTRKLGGTQILIDDSDKVRNGWTLGDTVNPTNTNIIEYLKGLLDL